MMVQEHIHQIGFIRKEEHECRLFGFCTPWAFWLLIYDIFPFLSSIKNTCSHDNIIKILCRDFNIKMELTTHMGTLQTKVVIGDLVLQIRKCLLCPLL